MTQSGLKIGFTGLALMGAPIAGRLLKAGHTLFINTRWRQMPEKTKVIGPD